VCCQTGLDTAIQPLHKLRDYNSLPRSGQDVKIVGSSRAALKGSRL
jgi:hypothetical protein